VKDLRGRGIGTEIVRFAVELGKRLGKLRLTIRPGSLSNQCETDLLAWYARRGLTPTAHDPNLLEMKLT